MSYVVSFAIAESMDVVTQPFQDPSLIVNLMIVTILCTALAAVNYHRILSGYKSHQQALSAAEEARRTELRACNTENAASMAKLAAALSHELNSPLGALRSAADSLLIAALKVRSSSEQARDRGVAAIIPLSESIRGATERLAAVIGRMQRFTNLDRAEIQSINLNDLMKDVTAIVEPHAGRPGSIELDLKPLPQFFGRPQPLSSVFSNLIYEMVGNAKVRVETRHVEDSAEVIIEALARDFASEQGGFDLEFRVDGERVSAGNWGLFAARQVIREQGGEIKVEHNRKGLVRVLVSLPSSATLAAARRSRSHESCTTSSMSLTGLSI
jgi:K+-sensing histidine kinase KdpD